MSFQAQNWAVKIKTGTPSAKAVLLLLANYADHTGFCYPSQERLAEELELTERTVRDALGRLEEMGVIRRERRFTHEGYRTSDGIRLNASYGKPLPSGPKGQAEGFSGRPSIPETISGRDDTLPETISEPTGNKQQILPETISGELPVRTTSKKKTMSADADREREEFFNIFWDEMPKKRTASKKEAWEAWKRHLKTRDEWLACAKAAVSFSEEKDAEAEKRHCAVTDLALLHPCRFISQEVWKNYGDNQEEAA